MLKKIVIETNKGFKIFGKCIRSGEENMLNTRQIFALLGYGRGIKIFEVLPNGELFRLNKENYDKENYKAPSVIIDQEFKKNNEGDVHPDELSNKDNASEPVKDEKNKVVEEVEMVDKKESVIENINNDTESDTAEIVKESNDIKNNTVITNSNNNHHVPKKGAKYYKK